MRKLKRRTFSGAVCEQEVYCVGDRVVNLAEAKPKLRFKTEEERQKFLDGISRRNHARLFNENFGPTSLYSTLTFSDDYEVHTFREARRIRDRYFRRLKYACPDAVIFFYMGRGKSTQRIHFHMVSEGVPEEVIIGKWVCGSITRVVHLREHNYYDGVDYGQDYTGLANYLFNHWTSEQGGHRWKQTKNTRKPDREEPTEPKRAYSENRPPQAPKGYILVETKTTKYGYLYFKYVKEPSRKTANRKISTEHCAGE